jgi:hypothetical protein
LIIVSCDVSSLLTLEVLEFGFGSFFSISAVVAKILFSPSRFCCSALLLPSAAASLFYSLKNSFITSIAIGPSFVK